MKNEISNLLTTSKIAEALGVSDIKVKKAIKELGIQPKAKKGVCNYYSREALAKIKQALKKAG
jgi:biotin operon repressor